MINWFVGFEHFETLQMMLGQGTSVGNEATNEDILDEKVGKLRVDSIKKVRLVNLFWLQG